MGFFAAFAAVLRGHGGESFTAKVPKEPGCSRGEAALK